MILVVLCVNIVYVAMRLVGVKQNMQLTSMMQQESLYFIKPARMK